MLIITISTLFERLAKIQINQFPKHENIKYVISCQGEKKYNDGYYLTQIKDIFGEDVICGWELKPGLSNNRNNAIKLACEYYKDTGSYIYICDDDVTPNIDGLLTSAHMMMNKKINCITGIITTDYGYFKNYPNASYEITKFSAARVSSVEIMIDLDFLCKHEVFFDSDFGLGSKYPSGEEYIFITDILKKKGIAYYHPIEFCSHPPVSSGSDFYTSNIKIMSKGAMLKRIFKFPISHILMLVFSLKKYNKYKHHISFLNFVNIILQGAKGYK